MGRAGASLPNSAEEGRERTSRESGRLCSALSTHRPRLALPFPITGLMAMTSATNFMFTAIELRHSRLKISCFFRTRFLSIQPHT
jgi:hypothetical protein